MYTEIRDLSNNLTGYIDDNINNTIPIDIRNRDYRKVLQWIADGGVPFPDPTIITRQNEQDERIAFQSQIDSEKADLPTWAQVATAIDNAFINNAQANIIKKIARPIYTYLKKSVT